MATFKWAILLVTIPAVFSAYISQRTEYHEPCSENSEIGTECLLKKLKDNCTENAGCDIPNAECKGDKCICKEYYFELKDQCVAGLNATCDEKNKCMTKDAECQKSKCQCKPKFVENKDGCLPVSQHNEECKVDAQCVAALNNTHCNEDEAVCDCIPKYHFKKDKCYSDKNVNEKCEEDGECLTPNTHCDETCKCDLGYKVDGDKCVLKKLGDTCANEKDCLFGHSSCKDKKCACENNYFEQNKQCVAGLDAPCKVTDECKTPKAECNLKENKCKCQSDHVAVAANECMPKVEHNKTCLHDKQCSESVAHTVCKPTEKEDKLCACEDKYLFKNGTCLLKKSLGDACAAKTDLCTTENSDCVSEKCQCVTGYHKDGDKCARNQVGDKCSKDDECPTENAKCTNKKCACKDTFFELEKQCVRGLDAKCSEQDECKASDSECREEKCQCKSKFVPTSVSECLPIVQHNRECKKDAQCSAGLVNSYCNVTKGEKTGVCNCVDKFHFKNDKCHPDKSVNEECTVTDECVTSNSHCDGKCKCDMGTSLIGKECVFQLGAECEKNDECKITNSECQVKKCACKKYFFDFEGKCLAGLDAKCSKQDECKASDSECREDKCQCKSKFVPTSVSECLPIVQYNEKCKKDVQCSAGLVNSYCKLKSGEKTGVCNCADKFHFKNNICHPDKLVNEECTVTDECLTPNTHCEGTCKCDLGYKVDGNKCVLKKLGDACANEKECLFGHSRCKDDKCACEANYFVEKDQCVAGLNAACKASDECKTPNAECNEKDKKCKCRSDHVAVAANECMPILKYKETCKHDLQCSEGLAHTFCNGTNGVRTGVCECEATYRFQKDKCYKEKKVNEKCTVKDDVCVTKNTDCTNGKCECVAKFPNLIDGVCSSSMITRPLFSVVALVLLALKFMF